ncbi:MAG: hypothetical protein NZ898_03230 [Myxococcota bacterium]|nr:hypothetical protein [Myxococcota bacterium]MDW8361761.1 hypothetical protein [Myxococcales bacterium]
MGLPVAYAFVVGLVVGGLVLLAAMLFAESRTRVVLGLGFGASTFGVTGVLCTLLGWPPRPSSTVAFAVFVALGATCLGARAAPTGRTRKSRARRGRVTRRRRT